MLAAPGQGDLVAALGAVAVDTYFWSPIHLYQVDRDFIVQAALW